MANDKDRPTNVASKLSYLGVESLSDAVEPLDLCQGLPKRPIVLAPKVGVELLGPKRNWAARVQDLADPFVPDPVLYLCNPAEFPVRTSL